MGIPESRPTRRACSRDPEDHQLACFPAYDGNTDGQEPEGHQVWAEADAVYRNVLDVSGPCDKHARCARLDHMSSLLDSRRRHFLPTNDRGNLNLKYKKLPSGSLLYCKLCKSHETVTYRSVLSAPSLCFAKHPVSPLECMAGTTGLEPATSAVTVSQRPVTYWNQEARMATQSTLKNPWNPLLHP